MQTREFAVAAEVEIAELERWVAEGWLLPDGDGEARVYTRIDLARAHFIRDIRGVGVNDEGIPIILDLVDQVHGLRRALRALAGARD